MKALVDRALKNSGDADRYCRRMMSNPTLAKLGCLPQELTAIANHEPPWFCHGLAFRMATYSDASDCLFRRWETLLNLAQQAEGWLVEYAHWSSADNHWAKKWDRFHHFLWLLQCYEYFSQRGLIVSFPASNNEAKPDLLIKRQGQEGIYAECYFYSKWWPRVQYFEALLCKIDKNLSIKRTYNVKSDASNNPFCDESDDKFAIAIDHLVTALRPDSLANLRAAAQLASPQTVCEFGNLTIQLEGTGDYQPAPNAHGDAAKSWPVFLKEIFRAKKNSNNLKGSRPNMVMVNALGPDYQFSLPESQGPQSEKLPCSIDEIWLSACGIDEELAKCQRVQKNFRDDYAGSGF